jgi:Ca2+-transporting ATPase
MITGDHPEIARTIALQAGIISNPRERIVTGSDLDNINKSGKISEKEIATCKVFARVVPAHKDMIIQTYQNVGKLVAMCGDGVNDAVAIAKADIGIAVIDGADVVKEAADVVITGGYEALANAVEIGRVIVHRTRLYLHYILSGNLCEIGVFLLAFIAGLPNPLTAISLLMINLLTDAAPAMAMAFEKVGSEVMREAPRKKEEGIINKQMWFSIAVQGLVTSIFLFVVFKSFLSLGIVYAQTATFTAYMFQKLLRAFTARSLNESVFSYGFLSNKYTIGAIVISLAIWFTVTVPLSTPFGFTKIEIVDILKILAFATLFPVIEELQKLILPKYFQKQAFQNGT